MVRDLTSDALRQAGYTALVAEHGARALELAGSHAGTIHMLITDVVMPELSGVQLAERLRRERPSLRTIFMSGYTEETIDQHGLEAGRAAFLAKPFMTETLLRKVRSVLDATSTTG